jgi:hypothetical protein
MGRIAQLMPPRKYDNLAQFVSADGSSYHEDISGFYGVMATTLAEVARTGSSRFFHTGCESYDASMISADFPKFARLVFGNYGTTLELDRYHRLRISDFPKGFWGRVADITMCDPSERSYTDWAQVYVAYEAVVFGRYHLARQVLHYDWPDSAVIERARNAVLAALDGIAGDFEVMLPMREVVTTRSVCHIYGVADFIDGDGDVWEFKHSAPLSGEHLLQLGCYLAMRGGGVGHLVSLTDLSIRTIRLAEADASAFLVKIAEAEDQKIENVDIFEVLSRYRRGAAAVPPADLPTDDTDSSEGCLDFSSVDFSEM